MKIVMLVFSEHSLKTAINISLFSENSYGNFEIKNVKKCSVVIFPFFSHKKVLDFHLKLNHGRTKLLCFNAVVFQYMFSKSGN